MGLSADDKKPVGITLTDAYKKIRSWYVANVELAITRGDEYGIRSAELINQLPSADAITTLEIRAILGEVIYGNLEWAYHQDDGQYKMAAYAHAALESSNLSWSLNQDDKEKLKESHIWQYLQISKH